MSTNDLFWLGAILLMLGGLILFYVMKLDEKKKLIQREIELAGANIVDISKGSGSDRSTFGFDVRFQDQEGRIYTTCCTVQMSSNQLYWTQDPRYLIEKSLGFKDMQVNSDEKSYPFSNIDSKLDDDGAKEMVINSLTSPFRHERQAMIKELAEFESVDDVVLQILQEMADGDVDEGVRKTAVATLQILNS